MIFCQNNCQCVVFKALDTENNNKNNNYFVYFTHLTTIVETKIKICYLLLSFCFCFFYSILFYCLFVLCLRVNFELRTDTESQGTRFIVKFIGAVAPSGVHHGEII